MILPPAPTQSGALFKPGHSVGVIDCWFRYHTRRPESRRSSHAARAWFAAILSHLHNPNRMFRLHALGEKLLPVDCAVGNLPYPI
jgi:hypothetical protein